MIIYIVVIFHFTYNCFVLVIIFAYLTKLYIHVHKYNMYGFMLLTKYYFNIVSSIQTLFTLRKILLIRTTMTTIKSQNKNTFSYVYITKKKNINK